MKSSPSYLGGFALQRSYFILWHLTLEHGREVLVTTTGRGVLLIATLLQAKNDSYRNCCYKQ